MTDPPPTNFTSFKKKYIYNLVTQDMWQVTRDTWHLTHDMWHMTCDMWHVTWEMWHVTHDTWHMTGRGRWNFCKNFSSLYIVRERKMFLKTLPRYFFLSFFRGQTKPFLAPLLEPEVWRGGSRIKLLIPSPRGEGIEHRESQPRIGNLVKVKVQTNR